MRILFLSFAMLYFRLVVVIVCGVGIINSVDLTDSLLVLWYSWFAVF